MIQIANFIGFLSNSGSIIIQIQPKKSNYQPIFGSPATIIQSWVHSHLIFVTYNNNSFRTFLTQVKTNKELLKESHVNHTALDVEVIGLQERVKELELEAKWAKGISDMHSKSFDSFRAQVKELEKFVEEQEEYNHRNTIMT